MPCKQCGNCCYPLWLNTPKSKVPSSDRAFLMRHWKRIGRKVALERLPEELRDDDWTGVFFYECEFFNPKTRKCMAHAERPPVCRGFPEYNDRKDMNERILKIFGCGYLT